jgi:hypothetical protein
VDSSNRHVKGRRVLSHGTKIWHGFHGKSPSLRVSWQRQMCPVERLG